MKKVKPVTEKQLFIGAVASVIATEVATDAFPKLLPFAPIGHGVSACLLAGSIFLLIKDVKKK